MSFEPAVADFLPFVEGSREQWAGLMGGRVMLTGATGFFGRSLVGTALCAARFHGGGPRLSLLTRDARGARRRLPLLDAPEVELIESDVRAMASTKGAYSHIIHAAVSPAAALKAKDPAEVTAFVVEGMRAALALARRDSCRVLFVSSGAVYGPQPESLPAIPEDFRPDSAAVSAYAQAKRAAEDLCFEAARSGLPVTVARCFSFIGPGLPLDAHFAAGNFVRDALAGGPVVVRSDGSAVRSYLFGDELGSWLWGVLLRGRPGRAYNVGSPEPVTILDFAREIAAAAGEVPVRVVGRPVNNGDRYVPDVSRAEAELGLCPRVSRSESIRRTLAWARGVRT